MARDKNAKTETASKLLKNWNATLDSDSPQAALGLTAKMILSNDCSGTNKLMEGRNGRGLIVLDVEETVQFGDLEQVTNPFAHVHQL